MGGVSFTCALSPSISAEKPDRMKRSKIQYDDRIVEVRWDFTREAWRFMRLRDDKQDGNHKDVVEKVIQTILDPVREADVSNIALKSPEYRLK